MTQEQHEAAKQTSEEFEKVVDDLKQMSYENKQYKKMIKDHMELFVDLARTANHKAIEYKKIGLTDTSEWHKGRRDAYILNVRSLRARERTYV